MKKMVIFSSIVEKKGVIYQLVVWGQEKIWVPPKTFLCFTFVIDVCCLYDLIRRSEFDLSRRTNFRPILALSEWCSSKQFWLFLNIQLSMKVGI